MKIQNLNRDIEGPEMVKLLLNSFKIEDNQGNVWQISDDPFTGLDIKLLSPGIHYSYMTDNNATTVVFADWSK